MALGALYIGRKLDRIIERLEPEKPDPLHVDKATMALHRIERHVTEMDLYIRRDEIAAKSKSFEAWIKSTPQPDETEQEGET